MDNVVGFGVPLPLPPASLSVPEKKKAPAKKRKPAQKPKKKPVGKKIRTENLPWN